jgi:hypothetical protein
MIMMHGKRKIRPRRSKHCLHSIDRADSKTVARSASAHCSQKQITALPSAIGIWSLMKSM